MKRSTTWLSAFLALPLACCTTYSEGDPLGSPDYLLGKREQPDGTKETYRLDVRSTVGDAWLQVIREYGVERPFLGFQVVELDKQHAEPRGVLPYRGLLVTGTYPESGAAAAGVLAGDVLLALDDRAMVYLTQVGDFEAGLRIGQEVTATVLRGQEERRLQLVAKATRENRTDRQMVELDTAIVGDRPYAGVVLRGIPSSWCERIYGEPREAVVVASVVTGSPAWIAGVRGGDVIEEVDGAPVPPVEELSRMIMRRGPAGDSMTWRVRRARDYPYEATLSLADYRRETNVWVPFICHVEDGSSRARWTIGPLGIVMSNRNHYVADQSTRDLQTRNVFSALLGLIHVESDPDETEVRLLWLIHFDV
jgi:C-terminal processing protease CtpA/Prc